MDDVVLLDERVHELVSRHRDHRLSVCINRPV
jgi:hypothetical protein